MEQNTKCNEMDESSSFYLLLNQIFEQEDIDKHNLNSKIRKFMSDSKLTKLEKKIYELILYLNPTADNFKSNINKEYIFNI